MKATYKIVARFHGEGLAAVQALATALDAAAGVEAARVSFPQPHRPHVDFVAYLPAVLAVRVFEAVNAANAESAVKGRLTYLRDRDAVEDLFCPESGPLLDFNID
ncbi:MAG: hypothetical protein BGO49_05660 [Planctomycetales bacterium 71-10]|nr:MAG: hypothetical protein BGO49_05660 [Planctomycetales bacterium 71-10]